MRRTRGGFVEQHRDSRASRRSSRRPRARPRSRRPSSPSPAARKAARRGRRCGVHARVRAKIDLAPRPRERERRRPRAAPRRAANVKTARWCDGSAVRSSSVAPPLAMAAAKRSSRADPSLADVGDRFDQRRTHGRASITRGLGAG
jgi:hypothetical protein